MKSISLLVPVTLYVRRVLPIIIVLIIFNTNLGLQQQSFFTRAFLIKPSFTHNHASTICTTTKTNLNAMKRPLLDQLATTLFNLEQNRVQSSSTFDSKGRYGEPMEWSQKQSLPNKVSEFIASNTLGYIMKQFIADIIAGEYDEQKTKDDIY